MESRKLKTSLVIYVHVNTHIVLGSRIEPRPRIRVHIKKIWLYNFPALRFIWRAQEYFLASVMGGGGRDEGLFFYDLLSLSSLSKRTLTSLKVVPLFEAGSLTLSHSVILVLLFLFPSPLT